MDIKTLFITLVMISTLAFLGYVSWYDYKYRTFKRRYILMFYPFVLLANYLINGNLMVTVMSFLFLLLALYFTEVIYNSTGVGTIDIIIAPLFTVWFNLHAMFFAFIFIALYALCWTPSILKMINKKYNTKGIPLVPVMMVSFIVNLFLVPSNIMNFIYTF